MRSKQGTFYKISNSPISIGMGNVLSTVSDKKIPVDNGNNGTIDWYIADITSATDYYPFGSPMDGRTFSSDKYRFGFNGKEKDDEVKGGGNSVDFGGRIYDSRLGRWLSVDPLMKKYPSYSHYNFSLNNPLFFIDKDGQEVQVHDQISRDLVLKTMTFMFGKDNGFDFDKNGKLIHNGDVPKNMTDGQKLMYKYTLEVLVKSNTVTTVYANKSFCTEEDYYGLMNAFFVSEDGGAASTTFTKGGVSYNEPPIKGGASSIKKREPNKNTILVSEKTMKDGCDVDFTDGITSVTPEYVLTHEFAHAMVNVIMKEMGGKFNGVDFNSMDPQQRKDWAIKFTNTLNKSNHSAQETGAGQHGRESEATPPPRDVAPLTE